MNLLLHNHIVLIGFKHVGKSVIGKSLAKLIHAPYIDLDKKIQNLYETKFDQKLTCRQIMEEHGENLFSSLEAKALANVVNIEPSILSLGGGTPLHSANRNIIKNCVLIHITAPREIVFERIRLSGRPAFFDPEEELLESFNRLWDEREKIYKEIQNFSIENNRSVDDAVQEIIKNLNSLKGGSRDQ